LELESNTGAAALTIDPADGSDAAIWLQEDGTNHWVIASDATDNRLKFTEKPGTDTEVMTLLQDGNVGIGTTAPSESLTLQSGTSGQPRIFLNNSNADASDAHIKFGKYSSSPADDDDLGTIAFLGHDSGGAELTYALMTAEASDVSDTTEDGRIFFQTRNAGSLDDTLALVSGNVGIGTTVPTDSLVVAGNANVTGNLVVGADGSGNLAIGTSTTSFNLDVRSGTSFLAGPSDHSIQDTYVILGRQNSDLRAHNISGQHSATASANYLSFAVHDTSTTTSTTEVMRLRGDGNVGIGTTSPAVELSIGTNLATDDTAQFIINDDSQFRLALGYSENGGTEGFIANTYNNNNGRFDIRMKGISGDDAKITVRGSGNVGIGTTSPDQELHVIGNVTINDSVTDGAIQIDSTNDAILFTG
ncbi:MAG: hypothetical protein QF704_13550, partial [Anaerolineales bacterium]|nr:hypothetical protein [Anaerolineales bacterium]